nr:hypothetical protein [uncultured Rhodopila sp.]
MGANSNIQTSLTADITDLTAKMAVASQDLRGYQAELKKAAQAGKEAGLSGDGLAATLQKQAAQVAATRVQISNLASKMRALSPEVQAADAATHAFTSNTIAMRETIVMAHETIMGNYKRLLGSTMVLAEHTGGLGAAFSALSGPIGLAVGATIGAAAAFASLAIRAHEAAVAVNEAANAAVFQGRSGAAASAQVEGFADALQKTGTISYGAAHQISAAIQQLPIVTEAQKEKINALAPGFFVKFKDDAEKTVQGIGEIFGSETALKTYLDKNQMLNVSQTAAWETAKTAEDRYSIGIEALSGRLGPVTQKYIEMAKAAKDWQTLASMAGGNEGGVSPFLPPQPQTPQNLGDAQTALGPQAPQAQPTQQIADMALVAKNAQAYRDLADATRTLDAANRVLKTSTDATALAMAESAKKSAEAKIAMIKDPGTADWTTKIAQAAKEAGDAAVNAAYSSGKSRLAITEAGIKAEMAVYKAASQEQGHAEAQTAAMHAQYVNLDMSLMKDLSRGAETGAKQAYAAKVAEYDQEIAAAKGNLDQILALEAQKLAYIKSVHGEASAQYQAALKEDTGAVNQAVETQVKTIEDAAKRQLADQKAMLKDEVATRQITLAQEAQQLLQFAQTTHDTEVQALSNLTNNLTQGTLAYKTAYDARTKINQEFFTQQRTLQAQADADGEKSVNKLTQSYINDFSQIGSSIERAFSGYLTYQTTMQKAEQEVARSILGSFVTLGEQMIERWLVTNLAMLTTSTQTQAAIQTVQNGSISATGFSQLIAAWTAKEATQTTITTGATASRTAVQTAGSTTANATTVAGWTATEATKTATTDAGAATRATADTGGGFLSSIGQILARWLGLETAKTTATVTQAGTRGSADGTAAIASTAVVMAAARAQIAAAAAEAAAWAFADSASLGPPGLVAAPGAAAAAETAVMAFQAAVPGLATGAYDVPRDMFARIHKDEAVLPVPFASAFRSAVSGGGGGGGDTNSAVNNFHYAPTFHGGGSAGLAASASKDFGGFKTQVIGMFRNGQLKVPGR